MASKQDIFNNVYCDKGGFGSKNRTLQEARKKDNAITINGINEFFRNENRKINREGRIHL